MTIYTQSEEDYLEAFYVIGIKNDVVRVKDVSNFLNVTMPSVVSAVRSLSEKGLVQQERYGHIELTQEGEEIAKTIYARHQLLYKFFHEVLGLEETEAQENACRVEHHLSKEALKGIEKLLESAGK